MNHADRIAVAGIAAKNAVKKALADGIIEMTIPDKPNSRLQKYRLTDMGHKRLVQNKEQ